MNDTVRRYTLAIIAHVALIVAWYLFVKLGNVPKFVMPSPGATLDSLLQPNYGWWANIAVTGTEIFAGYFLALVVGVALALLFSWSSVRHRVREYVALVLVLETGLLGVFSALGSTPR